MADTTTDAQSIPSVEPEAQTTATLSKAGSDPMAVLQAALSDALQQAASNRDGYLRVAAEMENLRKRAQRDVENAHKFGLERILAELLPVRDSLETGVAAADQTAAGLKEGMDLTLKLLVATLGRFGVSELAPARGGCSIPTCMRRWQRRRCQGWPRGRCCRRCRKATC